MFGGTLNSPQLLPTSLLPFLMGRFSPVPLLAHWTLIVLNAIVPLIIFFLLSC
jgi:hypothetical protein